MTHRSEIDWSQLGLSFVAAAVVSAFAAQTYALSFGNEQVSSSLGQPLRMSIPLLGTAGDSFEAACFRLVSPTRTDGIPSITQARIELQTSSSPARLLVRGVRAIDEPIVRVTIEAGCDAPIRRDYTILLDPPSVAAMSPEALSVPTAQNLSVVSALGAASARSQSESIAAASTSKSGTEASDAGSVPSAKIDGKSSKPRKARVDPSRQRIASGEEQKAPPSLGARNSHRTKALETRDQLKVQGGSVNSESTIDAASLAALAIPHLRISADLPSFSDTLGLPTQPGNELQAAVANERRNRLFSAPIEEDLAPRLEADLVVTRRRLAELQAQIGGAGGTAGVTESASPVSSTNDGMRVPVAPSTTTNNGRADFNLQSWLWLSALAAAAGLVLFLLGRRSAKKQAPKFEAVATATVMQSDLDEFDTVMPVKTVVPTPSGAPNASAFSASDIIDATGAERALIGSANSSEPAASVVGVTARRAQQEATDKLNHSLFQLHDTASQVDVSELSQATDEAQVYADLGRADKAISILRNHIQHIAGDRASPVPWLMIFDLYRRTNNRAGYDELAPQFRQHFNGRMPDWDSYGHELALDDGLEAFPHLIARVERNWGKPEVRKFLDELLFDNRGGSRLGFSLAAYRDLLMLLQVHDVLVTLPSTDLLKADWESRGANDDDGTPRWDLELSLIEQPQSSELDSFLKGGPKG